jgi:beta-lactam-binding protein with PASTA domain
MGQGTENETTEIPEITGLKQSEAIRMLKMNSLNVGKEVFEDGRDTSVSRVYKLYPGEGSVVNMGTVVNIWYHSEKKYKFKKHINN